jgi:hypothetical protein
MDNTIRITASLRIDRPADEVRAQYRDIDHHIRNNVHPSIRYQWEPAERGERKIRTTFRILGVPQFDVSLLEDAEDGSFVIRYLEGSNAGMVLVHKFVPLGSEATDVQLSADAPSTLGRKMLGPLFVVGARQVMKKALAEDKRDLEKGSFRVGAAAGDVEGALASLRGLASRDPAAKRALLECASLVAVADGVVDSAERDAIGRLAKILSAESEIAWVHGRLDDLVAIGATERIASEADRIGAVLRTAALAREALVAASVVGLVSEGMSLGELAVFRRMGVAAGIAEDDLGPIVNAADAALAAAG